MILNCATIDDEPHALNLMNSFVSRTPFLNLTASFETASVALARLQETDVHLVFLDINMPGITGIEIAHSLLNTDRQLLPKVIFSTAHNEFAAESYKVEALDYLLKPFEYNEFLKAAQKGLQFFDKTAARRQFTDEMLYVKNGHQLMQVPFEEIKYIQGMKDYAVIHFKNPEKKQLVTLTTMKSLNTRLPAARFMRVQRSFIVALDAVTALKTNNLWIDDLQITIGGQYKEGVQAVFKRGLPDGFQNPL